MDTLENQPVRAVCAWVYSPAVDWRTLRAHFEREFLALKAKGETQKSVARRGGLKEQNAISKLLSNRNLGPQAETFIRAIEGLGLKPSEFFLQIETAGSGEKNLPAAMHVTYPDTSASDKRGSTIRKYIEGADHGAAVSDTEVAILREIATAIFQHAASLVDDRAKREISESDRALREARGRLAKRGKRRS